jgi:hypothetical protein
VLVSAHCRLGSVAGPVIQATGWSEFEDGLGSGDFVSGYSYHISVRTRLSDHTKQTKFQSQRPNDVETPVPSISSTEVQQHRDSQYLDGTALSDIPSQGKMLIASVGPRWCRHHEEMIYTCTYSERRILPLIVSGTLANAGRPERVKNEKRSAHCVLLLLVVM